ncbi:MAG: flagellar hook protein FlgE [Defluviitaleaceae bacterium]|nr:flagellar hook protein FlgE [Defluviitaleaceae bacterium]
MMRSMFSGVSSLRVHQTRMDVIANNIANVNTDGFKASRATFADSFYQNLQGASGPDPAFGRSGRNPQQVGLGLNLASIDNLMHQGIARRTDNALDVAIEGGGFFIVRDRGGANMFTRAGRIERDAHWNLHIGGNMLMGWSTIPDANTPGGHAVDRGLLVPLAITGDKRQMPSEPTTLINIEGNLRTTQLSYNAATGEHYRMFPKTIYDSLGNPYVVNVRMVYHQQFSEASDSPHSYWTMEFPTVYVNMDPATGSVDRTATGDIDFRETLPTPAPAGNWVPVVRAFLEGDTRNPSFISICLLGGAGTMASGGRDDFVRNAQTSMTVAFDSNGNFVGMGLTTQAAVAGPPAVPAGSPIAFLSSAQAAPALGMGAIDPTATTGPTWVRGNVFQANIVPIAGVAPAATLGYTAGSTSYYHPGPTTTPPIDTVVTRVGHLTFNFQGLGQRGTENTTIRALMQDGGGPGRLEDIMIGADGTIRGRFSNGRDRVLGQIPLAFFDNPAGLERAGNSLWRETANSGPFDGVGLIGAMIGGALEGSNVDLANEFTDMITTQRGFQAASRTITVSDEMLQELVNLRR